MRVHAKQIRAKGGAAGSGLAGSYCSLRRASHSFTISPATTGQMVRRQRHPPPTRSRSKGARTADAVGQVGELLGVVQHLHALGVGVVAHREGLGDGGCKFPVEQASW